MNEFDELMDVENEVEDFEGKRDLSGYVGAGTIALAGIAIYEGGKQLGKRVVKPLWGKAKNAVANRRKAKDSAAEEATVEAEPEEK